MCQAFTAYKPSRYLTSSGKQTSESIRPVKDLLGPGFFWVVVLS